MKCQKPKLNLAVVLSSLIILFNSPVSAQKDDTIRLDNGDWITGEIKKVDHGILELKTSDIGTIKIEWDKIHSVKSKKSFEIYLLDNSTYFGKIDSSFTESARIQLLITEEEMNNYLDLITKLDPIKRTFFERLDIDLEFGYQYNKGSNISTIYNAYNLFYRSQRHGLTLYGDNYITKQITDGQEFKKLDVAFEYHYYMKKSWMLTALVAAEQNTEIGLDLRTLIGASLGKRIFQSEKMDMWIAGGLSANEELSTDGIATNNLESVLGTEFQLFKFHNPEIKVNLDWTIYQSFNVSNRIRHVGNIKVKFEVFSDFYFDVTFYENFDNVPPDASAANEDFGITTSISYSF